MSELLEEIASKQAHAILEVRNGKKLKRLKEAEEGEDEREVMYRDPETGKLGKKMIKLPPRQQGMLSKEPVKTPKVRTTRSSVMKGDKGYDELMAQAKAELERQMAADKEARYAGKPSQTKLNIATQAADDDTFTPRVTGRRQRAGGQDGDEDKTYDPDQLGTRRRLGMDETSHKRGVKKLKELKDSTLKSYTKKAKKSAERELRKSDEREDKAMSTDGEKHPERQQKHVERAKGHFKKYQKRQKGMSTAKEKLDTRSK